MVALCIAETKYMEAAHSAIQLRRMLDFLWYNQVGPTKIYCDRNSAIELSKNPVFHGRNKHIISSFTSFIN